MDALELLFSIFTLLVIYQVKHFLCDYPLQGKYMLGKFKPDFGFFLPLLAHSLVHAFATLLIVLWYSSYIKEISSNLIFELVLTDLIIHFVMDRIKAGPRYLGRFKDMMHFSFWWSLGLDQTVHHLTHYYIIFRLVTA